MARRVIEQANVRSWEKTCIEAKDWQIQLWMRYPNWSVWRKDVLVSVAQERNLL